MRIVFKTNYMQDIRPWKDTYQLVLYLILLAVVIAAPLLIDDFYLGVAAIFTEQRGNSSKTWLAKFPIQNVHHRIISISHEKQGKARVKADHFYVQKPGKNF